MMLGTTIETLLLRGNAWRYAKNMAPPTLTTPIARTTLSTTKNTDVQGSIRQASRFQGGMTCGAPIPPLDELSQELEKKHKVPKVPGHYMNQPETPSQKTAAGSHPHEQPQPSSASINTAPHDHPESDIKDCYCSNELKQEGGHIDLHTAKEVKEEGDKMSWEVVSGRVPPVTHGMTDANANQSEQPKSQFFQSTEQHSNQSSQGAHDILKSNGEKVISNDRINQKDQKEKIPWNVFHSH